MKKEIKEKRLFSELETEFWLKRSKIAMTEIKKVVDSYYKGKYKTDWIAVNEIKEILEKYSDYLLKWFLPKPNFKKER